MTGESVSTSGDVIMRNLSVTAGSKVTHLPFLCGLLLVGHLSSPLTPTICLPQRATFVKGLLPTSDYWLNAKI